MYSPDLTSLISPIERGLSAPGPSTLIRPGHWALIRNLYRIAAIIWA